MMNHWSWGAILKRIMPVACAIIFFTLPLSANQIIIDGYGASLGVAREVPNLIGGGGTFGLSLFEGGALIYRGMYALASTKPRYREEKKYRHMMHMGGFEYTLTIPEARFGWRTSLMAGYSETRIDGINYTLNFLEVIAADAVGLVSDELATYHLLAHVRNRRDRGMAIAAWTGIEFQVTDWFAPFVDIGIHRSWYYRDLKSRLILGYHCIFGFRFRVAAPSR